MKQLALQLGADTPRRRRKGALLSFHPRLEAPAEAFAGEVRAGRQEAALLQWFRLWGPGVRFTPSEVHAAPALAELRCPLTSIRRALTNLTRRADLLHHATDRRKGPHGAKESTWSLA